MPQAAGLFNTAVRNITIADAIDIVRGGDDSATRYLRGSTETRLTSLLKPPMTRALTRVWRVYDHALGVARNWTRQHDN